MEEVGGMKGWLRRIRGAVGMGVAWGVTWLGAGLLMMLAMLLLTGETGADVPYPLGFGALGFVAGVAFSLVVGVLGRNRRFDQLSIPRFAAWGGAGGLLFSTLFVAAVALLDDPTFWSAWPVLAPVFSGAGAASAAGILALARKAADPDFAGELEPGDDLHRLP
jgi:hypothetical protein